MSTALAAIFIGVGTTLMVLAGIGIHKYNDFFYRIHVVSKGPSLGVMLILLGVSFYFGTLLTTVKCLAIALFIFITIPVSCSLLALARYEILYGKLEDDDSPAEADKSDNFQG